MLDVRFILDNRERVKEAVGAKREKADVDLICATYDRKKGILGRLEDLRRQLNEASNAVSRAKREGRDASAMIAENRALGDRIKGVDAEIQTVDRELDHLLWWVPNLPDDDVPRGAGADGNVEVRRWGDPPRMTFTPKPHWDIIDNLRLADVERSGRMSGANFILFRGQGARLERALINMMLDLHTKKHGYTEIAPPYLVNRAAMFGTGQIPKLEEDMYRLKDDDLFLIPTGEVPITNIHAKETLSFEQLPVKYVGYTACFRREAGAYGRDTRGFLRVHQFDKVELVKFAHPDASAAELEALLADAEEVLQTLGLPYRVIKLCTGDMSFASAKTYDIEVWSPGVGKWLEVSSCSNFREFQARRSQARFRDKDGKMKFLHTLNGSGVALPRTVIGILENFQREDGRVRVPEALIPYMDGCSVIG